MLSARSERAQSPGLPYWGLFARALGNLHGPANPSGIVSLCVAENALSGQLVASRLAAVAGAAAQTGGQLGYDDMRGRHCLRRAFSALAERLITRGARVDPARLCIAGGCGALIQHLAFLLADPGDCMLLATPTYGMLFNDVGVLAGIQVEDVPIVPGAALTPKDLDAAVARATARGLRPRLLFVINPENPLGTVRGAAELRGVLAWARAQGPHFHLVADEIYALSVYDSEVGEPFTSAATLCSQGAGEGAGAGGDSYLGDNVHILWGFSKDFCASGLRVGILLSHNAALLRALDNVGYFSAASNPVQDALALALAEGSPQPQPPSSAGHWVDAFLAQNCARLREGRDAVCNALEGAGVPHVRPCAGLFVWLDLGAWLEAPTFEAERSFTEALFAAGLLMTPGEACHSATPGCFRCCFAWHSEMDSLRVGMERLVAFLAARGRRPLEGVV